MMWAIMITQSDKLEMNEFPTWIIDEIVFFFVFGVCSWLHEGTKLMNFLDFFRANKKNC